MDSHKKELRSLTIHALLWLGALVVLVSSNLAVTKGDAFGGLTPVPLRSNPNLIVLASLGIPISLVIGWLANAKLPRRWKIVSWAGVVVAGMCFGALIGAVKPSSGSVLARDVIYPPPAPPPEPRVFALPVYFSNGQDRLTPSEGERIRDAVAVFSACESGTLLVRGFASSLPYATETEFKNKTLANDRAKSVKAALDVATNQSAKLVEWETHADMVRAKSLRDLGANGQRLLREERLNRRVEVFWNDSPCNQELPLSPEMSKGLAEGVKPISLKAR